MPITVFHNPSCTKSLGTLQLLKERGLECDVIHYLQTPPNRATLEELIGMLGSWSSVLKEQKIEPAVSVVVEENNPGAHLVWH